MIVVLMGAAGAGKTTVGRALAEHLHWPFVDADDLHSVENIARMSSGIALDDADRGPWLARLHMVMADTASRGLDMVLACSALREQYRVQLSHGIPDVRWVFLRASRALLENRLSARRGHFAGPAILDAQLAALEPPRNGIEVDAEQPIATVVHEIRQSLQI